MPVQGLVLANPALDSTGSVPDFVELVEIDYATHAPATSAPVIVLTGEDDTIAAPAQALELDDLLAAAPSVVYQATSDDHGSPALDADHMVPIQDSGIIPGWMMTFLGGTAEEDALDFRFTYAALDALLAGQTSLAFAMGEWSDGTPVAEVVRLRP